MGLKKKIVGGVVACLFGGVLVAAPAFAGGVNKGYTWQEKFGAQIYGHVQIQASYNDAGRHARRGYQRFTRAAGPSLDTGNMYTSAATSRTDAAVRSREDMVWDSPLWGDSYVTHYNYNFLYF